jgi:hypothetical protein
VWFADQVRRSKKLPPDDKFNELRERIEKFDREWLIKFETILHQAMAGPMWMKDERVADAVARNLRRLDGEAYRLDAYSVIQTMFMLFSCPYSPSMNCMRVVIRMDI